MAVHKLVVGAKHVLKTQSPSCLLLPRLASHSTSHLDRMQVTSMQASQKALKKEQKKQRKRVKCCLAVLSQ